jgi:hypothetical protein
MALHHPRRAPAGLAGNRVTCSATSVPGHVTSLLFIYLISEFTAYLFYFGRCTGTGSTHTRPLLDHHHVRPVVITAATHLRLTC